MSIFSETSVKHISLLNPEIHLISLFRAVGSASWWNKIFLILHRVTNFVAIVRSMSHGCTGDVSSDGTQGGIYRMFWMPAVFDVWLGYRDQTVNSSFQVLISDLSNPSWLKTNGIDTS